MRFDNHDSRIRYIDLMLSGTLDQIPQYDLPAGYRFVFYEDGDRDAWIDIEISAKELESFEEGKTVWEKYYGGYEDELKDRMFFIETETGEKVATATAYHDPSGVDPPTLGQLHWVAVRRDHQGKGLARPLISHTLRQLSRLGCTAAKIHTQTTTWLACKLYLDLGFLPTPESAEQNRAGWEIILALTDHPALTGFARAGMEQILAEDHREND